MAKKIWNKLGWILFWLCLPALHVYLRRGNRPRILVMHRDKILLVRSWLSDGRWQLPGGGAHKHEDPKAAAIRELYEETGVKVNPKNVSAKAVHRQDADLLHFSYHLFRAKSNSIALPVHKTAEITQVEWVHKKDLHIGNAQQHVLDALK